MRRGFPLLVLVGVGCYGNFQLISESDAGAGADSSPPSGDSGMMTVATMQSGQLSVANPGGLNACSDTIPESSTVAVTPTTILDGVILGVAAAPDGSEIFAVDASTFYRSDDSTATTLPIGWSSMEGGGLAVAAGLGSFVVLTAGSLEVTAASDGSQMGELFLSAASVALSQSTAGVLVAGSRQGNLTFVGASGMTTVDGTGAHISSLAIVGGSVLGGHGGGWLSAASDGSSATYYETGGHWVGGVAAWPSGARDALLSVIGGNCDAVFSCEVPCDTPVELDGSADFAFAGQIGATDNTECPIHASGTMIAIGGYDQLWFSRDSGATFRWVDGVGDCDRPVSINDIAFISPYFFFATHDGLLRVHEDELVAD